MTADDFGELQQEDVSNEAKPNTSESKQKKREWLYVYETTPSQFLNAYGQAKYRKMSNGEVSMEAHESATEVGSAVDGRASVER